MVPRRPLKSKKDPQLRTKTAADELQDRPRIASAKKATKSHKRSTECRSGLKKKQAKESAEDLSLDNCLTDTERKPKRRRFTSTTANTANESDRKTFLNRLETDESKRGTFVPQWVLRIVANSTDAIVLSQLYYWLRRSKHKPQARRGLRRSWVAKSAVDLAKELNRSVDSITKSLGRLRKQGLIDWVSRKFGGVKQRHISIIWSNVHLAYKQVTQELSNSAHQ